MRSNTIGWALMFKRYAVSTVLLPRGSGVSVGAERTVRSVRDALAAQGQRDIVVQALSIKNAA